MEENCSVLDPWAYRPYPCVSEAVFDRENDVLTKALRMSLLSDSSSAAAAPVIPSPESLSAVTSSLYLPPAGGPSPRRDRPAGRVAKKRKSRASKRSPTTYITADAANFRELVQRVTGTGSGDEGGLPVGPPPPPPAAVHGSRLLPTLDTSALSLDRTGLVGPAADGPALTQFDPFYLMPSFLPTIDSWAVM